MKWALTSNKQAIIHEYQLMDENSCKVVAKINPLHKSVRIICDNQYRLFFIERVSPFSDKHIYTNEYGMEIGSMTLDKQHKTEGTIVIDSTRYFYREQSNPMPTLQIYGKGKFQPLFDCTLQSNGTGVSMAAKINEIDNKFLLLSLCWFANLKTSKEFAY